MIQPDQGASPTMHDPDGLRLALREAEARHAAQGSRLRHDVRGALSPALLMADRLSLSPDPDKRRVGEVIAASILRAVELLGKPQPQPETDAG